MEAVEAVEHDRRMGILFSWPFGILAAGACAGERWPDASRQAGRVVFAFASAAVASGRPIIELELNSLII